MPTQMTHLNILCIVFMDNIQDIDLKIQKSEETKIITLFQSNPVVIFLMILWH